MNADQHSLRRAGAALLLKGLPGFGKAGAAPRARLRQLARSTLGHAIGGLGANERFRQIAFNAIRRSARTPLPEQLGFLCWVWLNAHRSSAQILQDLWVTYELRDRRQGFFVEFGATNGRTNSNSWLLESDYEWKGILSEPNPAWHEDLKRSRSCAIETRCVAQRSGELVDFSVTSDPELSSLSAYTGNDPMAVNRTAFSTIRVETISLSDLLDLHGAPATIDYLSIDTEGSELDILSSFDFGRRRIELFSVEHNYSSAQAELDALFLRNGYEKRFPEYSQWDSWYRLRNRNGNPRHDDV